VVHEVVARAESARGEVVVRRRAGGAPGDPIGTADGALLELRVNGVFVMDTAETGTERRLARATLAQVAQPRRVLVGGLGLGFTLAELLTDPRVEQVLVAEIEPAVVTWMRQGVLPGGEYLADPRVRVVVADLRDLVADLAGGDHDVILLDVDNGPDFLVHEGNAALYEPGFLTRCRRLLAAQGALSVWSSTGSPALETAMREVFGDCRVDPVAVDLQGRDERYWLFTSKMVP
jgi:spermidine synthase